MKGGHRLSSVIFCLSVVAALPVIGSTTVGAASPPPAASPASVSSHMTPFHPLTSLERAAAKTRTLKRGGSAPVNRRGLANAGRATGSTPANLSSSLTTQSRNRSVPLIASSAPEKLADFAGTAQASTIHSFGGDQEVTPPNEDIAAGPTTLVEVVNSTVEIFNRSGGYLGADDLNTFMDVFSGYHSTDPRVIYDASAGRFWITITEVPNSYSSPGNCPPAAPVLIAVSPSSNPLPFTGWIVYQLPMQTFGGTTGQPLTQFGDQPGLGIATNTVTVTFNDFTCANAFNGSEIDVLQKVDFEHDSGTNSLDFFYDGPFAPQPVQALGTMNVQYLVGNQSDCAGNGCDSGTPAAEVDMFAGTPEGGGVGLPTITSIPMTPTVVAGTGFLPPANQPSPGPQLQTNDDRFLNAVWENGQIWTADGTSCLPSGDTVQRNCLDYVEIAASGSGTVGSTLTNQLDNVGVNGQDLFYPAVSVDGAGDVLTVFDESSATDLPTVKDASIAAGGAALSNFQTLHTSSTYYNGDELFAGACDTEGCRWGDYSGAAQDPVNPKDVWVVSGSQDGVIGSACTTVHACWNTRIDDMTVSGPTITSLTPASGPVAGGQMVTVHGLDFGIDDTTAKFGGLPLTISALTSTSFTFVTAPSALAGGTDPVQATDPLGTTGTLTYTYIGLANYVPVTPFRILDTRKVGGPIGQGLVRTVQITGAGTPPIPPSATAAVLNITEVSGSASSLLTVYPFNTTKPNASNLNFPAHTVIANLVTVTLSSDGKINIYNALGSVNVLVDVEGYFTPQPATDVTGLFHPIAPVRVCDTRTAAKCGGHTAVGPGRSIVVTVASPAAIPNDGSAGAAVVNLTGVAGTASTYLNLSPTTSTGGCPATGTSTINLLAGAVVANRVMVQLGPTSTGGPTDALCVFNAVGTINVLVDANGWYGSSTAPSSPAGFQYQALGPTRICDTRVASASCSLGAIGSAQSRLITVAGHAGVPAFSSPTVVVAIIANLTAVVPSATTYLALYPANLTRPPGVSDINLNPGVVLPNLAVVQLDTIAGSGQDGNAYLYNAVGSVNAIIDIEGWFQ